MRINQHYLVVPLTLFVIPLLVSCTQNNTGADSSSNWQRVQKSELSEDNRNRFRRAEKARGDLAGTLMGRVKQVLSRKGPSDAIQVCNLEAHGLTRKVGKKHDVEIGRTSFRLRNPDNKPPEWARKFNLIEERVKEQVILMKSSDHMAVLSPIRLGKKCATCHGPEETLSRDVKETLAERYPNDEATGFEPGDLRGWFWVEVADS